jgi:hypothetical protein
MKMSDLYPMKQLKRRMARTAAVRKPQPKVVGYDEKKAGVAAILLFVQLGKVKNDLLRERHVRQALEPFGGGERAVKRVMGMATTYGHDGEAFKGMFCMVVREAYGLPGLVS